MSSELRRAAEAVVNDWNEGDGFMKAHLLDGLEAALSAPDELEKAREIIKEVLDSGVSFADERIKYVEVQLSRQLLDEAREFLKRTGAE